MDRRCLGSLLLALLLAGQGVAEPHAFTVIDGHNVPLPLGGLEGDPVRGKALVEKHCASCHTAALPVPRKVAGELRLAIVDLSMAGVTSPDHAFYAPTASGTTALSAQQIEDIVAWLVQLAE